MLHFELVKLSNKTITIMKKHLFTLFFVLVGLSIFAQSSNQILAEKYTDIFITNVESNITLSKEEKEVILVAKKAQLLAQFNSRDVLKKEDPKLFREKTIERSAAFTAVLSDKFGHPRAREIVRAGKPKK